MYVNIFTSMMQTFLLPNTPTLVVMLIVTILSIQMAKSGIEVLGRLIFLLYIFIMLIYFPIFGLGIFGQFKIENITPVFVISPLQFIKGVYFHAGLYAETGLLSLMIIVAILPKAKKYYKAITLGALMTAFFHSLAIFFTIGLLGVEQASIMHFADINAIQSIQVAGFLYGLEILTLACYIMGIYSFISIHFYNSWTAIMQIFNNWEPGVWWWVLFIVITGMAIGMNSYNTAYAVSIFLAKFIMLPFVILVLNPSNPHNPD